MLTNEKFIERAIKVHGNKYDYSKVDYTGNANKVIIICKVHGEFYQKPNHHWDGNGCPECMGLKRYSNQEFIIKAKAIHNNFYDYSKTRYINSYTPVTVICPNHGEFYPQPATHLLKRGCMKCFYDRIANTTDKFIKKAREVHGDKYNYSKVVYINRTTKVVIICPIHGEFKQSPRDHIQGTGCPICSSSKGELAIKAILDKRSIKYIQQYKIPEVANRFSYDFYLPEYNLLIEFHGGQHYKYIPFFHRNGEDDFLKQKNRDDMVRSNARQFKYRYLEFNYKQLKVGILEKIITDKLKIV